MTSHIHRPLSTSRRKPLVASISTVAVLAVTLGACGGSTPENEPAPNIAEPPSSATPLSLEWTDADLEKSAERIGYGPKPPSILARSAEGVLVFSPQTDRDHVATRFAALPAFSGERTLELVLDMKEPGGQACAANLQDQSYNLIASVPCKTAGQQRASAKVAPGVSGVRVYFQSPTREALRLPARMHLTEQR